MIYTPRRFPIFMRRTTISHFAFLISNFSFKRGFRTQSGDAPPQGLTLAYRFPKKGENWIALGNQNELRVESLEKEFGAIQLSVYRIPNG